MKKVGIFFSLLVIMPLYGSDIEQLSDDIAALSMDSDSDRQFALDLMFTEISPEVEHTRLEPQKLTALRNHAKTLKGFALNNNDLEIINTFLTATTPACPAAQPKKKPSDDNLNDLIQQLEQEEKALSTNASALEAQLEATQILSKKVNAKLNEVKALHEKYKKNALLGNQKGKLAGIADRLKKEMTRLSQAIGTANARIRDEQRVGTAEVRSAERKIKPKFILPAKPTACKRQPLSSLVEGAPQEGVVSPAVLSFLDKINFFEALDLETIKLFAIVLHNNLLGSTLALRMANQRLLEEFKNKRLQYNEDGSLKRHESLAAIEALKELPNNTSTIMNFIKNFVQFTPLHTTNKKQVDELINIFMQDDCFTFADLTEDELLDRGLSTSNLLISTYKGRKSNPVYTLLRDPQIIRYAEAIRTNTSMDTLRRQELLEKIIQRLNTIGQNCIIESSDTEPQEIVELLKNLFICTGIWNMTKLKNHDEQEQLISKQLLLLYALIDGARLCQEDGI